MASYEHTTTFQSNLNWGETFKMTVKAPAIADRIFKTWDDANKYIHDRGNSAIAGLNLSVIDDSDRNGVYFIDSIRRSEGYVDDFGNVYHAGEKELVMVQLASGGGGGKFNYSGIQIGTGEQMDVWTGTLEEFNQLTPDEHTVYFIDGGGYKSKKNWFYVQNINDTPESMEVYETGDGGITVEISRDGFEWEEWITTEPEQTYTMELQPGEKVYMRSKTNSWENTGMMGMSKVGGNILSLLYGADFDDSQRTLPEGVQHFNYMFEGSPLKDAGELIIDVEKAYTQSFWGMFSQCTQLKTPPQIRIGNVGENGCEEMFSGCTSLEYAPALTATVVDKYGYYKMFQGCTSLVSAPTISATTIGDYGCQGMFQGCNSLVSAPTLTATKVGAWGYSQMFRGCTSLVSAPVIAVTDMGNRCCDSMFQGCTALTHVSNLPATTLSEECYLQMFQGCTSLVDMPEIMAEETNVRSCQEMFMGCTSLRNVTDLPANTVNAQAYRYMFRGCTSLVSAPTISATTIGDYGLANMFEGCTSLQNVADFNFYDIGTSGCYAMFKDCTSLESMPDIPCEITTRSCYQSMFEGCTSLKYPTSLHATTLDNNCYQSMFKGCTSLTMAPVMVPVSVGQSSMANMFRGCTSLVSTSSLPAVELANYCYSNMFKGCTSLTKFPEIEAVTTGVGSMANMFEGCTALGMPPSLQALEVVGEAGARNMFKDCTALEVTPNLQRVRVINNAGCQGMFQGCTSLTHTAPMGPVSLSNALNSCKSMYQDCTSLTAAGPIRITNGATNNCTDMFKNCKNLCMVSNLTDNYEAIQPWQCESNWMVGVANNGVFVKADGVEWGRSWSGVPASWVIISESDLTRGDIMYYKTSDGNVITPNTSKFADENRNPVSITSNTVNTNGIGEIRFSAPVHYITGAAFMGQLNLKAVWLPYTVVDTGQGTFNDCTNLKMIWIWENVEVIGATFNGLTSLQKVYVHATEPPVLSVNQANNLKNYGASVYVPHESLRLYTEANNWSTIADQIVGM